MRDYAKAQRRARSVEDALYGNPTEDRSRFSELVRIERRADRYCVTFPTFDPKRREIWALVADVKAITGRRWDAITKVWTVPATSSAEVEIFAATYGAEIIEIANDSEAEIARLLAEIAQRDQYIAGLEAELAKVAA
jgi:hypothetical protein